MNISSTFSRLKKYRAKITIGTVLLLTLIGFQNCSDKVAFTSGQDGASLSLSLIDGALKINNGSFYTNNQTVLLAIESTVAASSVQMTLANTDCATAAALSPATLWESFQATRQWLLSDADGAQAVSLFLQSPDGKTSACIDGSITLDRVAPVVDFDSAPTKFTNLTGANFQFKASDDRSGIAKLICRDSSASGFTECTTKMDIANLAEGTHALSVYAIDKAGNVSDSVEYSWLVDLTRPTVAISAPLPPATSLVNAVSVYFDGNDGAGSGVDHYECYLNTQAIPNCVSPVLLQNLPDTTYAFKVRAVDKVGLASDYAQANFVVDTKPSGDFKILGVSGGTDKTIDNYLTDVSAPTVNWSLSLGAESYRIQILNETKTAVVCGPIASNSATIQAAAFTAAGCTLTNGAKYYARISAFRNTLEKTTDDLAFQVDTSGPVITIVKVTHDDELKTAHVDFTVTDAVSGVKTATCYKQFGADMQQTDCTNVTSIDYAKLSDGDHMFSISAVDKIGNTSTSTPVKITIQAVICDPFHLTAEAKCQKGLRSNLYYASAADRAKGNTTLGTLFSTVGKLITGGVKSNTLIYLPTLDVPLRAFTDGFSTTAGKFIADDAGVKLDEWFALEITSYLKLGDTDTEGYYQLMVVSDDGSNLYTDANKTGTYKLLINNDGTHSNKVGCTAKGGEVYMTKTTRLPIKIEYYQGPRTQIAMTMYWRKVSAAGSDLSATCSKVSSDATEWFGTSGTGGFYNQIKGEGFVSPSDKNYISE